MIIFLLAVLLAIQWFLFFPELANANRSGVTLTLSEVFVWAILGEMAAGATNDYLLAVLIPILGLVFTRGVSRLESGDASS